MGTYRSSTAVRDSRLRMLLCLFVCLSAWRGPIPWVHCHKEPVDGVFSDPSTCLHWCRHHDELSEIASDPTDWHWHWILPCEISLDGTQAPAPDENLSFAALVSQFEWTKSASTSDLRCIDFEMLPVSRCASTNANAEPPNEDQASRRATGFLNTYADSVTMQSLIAVILC